MSQVHERVVAEVTDCAWQLVNLYWEVARERMRGI